jgi:2Fe-2S ferredoxin
MNRVTFVHPDGRTNTVEVADGRTVMKAATENLIPGIVGECGGDLSCATCHVFVDEAWTDKLPPRSTDEEQMLDVTSEEPTAHSRLSCQIRMTPELDDLVVHVPETQW